MMPVLIVLGLAALVVFVTLSQIVKKLLYVSAPNEALIFSGRVRHAGNKEVGYRVPDYVDRPDWWKDEIAPKP